MVGWLGCVWLSYVWLWLWLVRLIEVSWVG